MLDLKLNHSTYLQICCDLMVAAVMLDLKLYHSIYMRTCYGLIVVSCLVK